MFSFDSRTTVSFSLFFFGISSHLDSIADILDEEDPVEIIISGVRLSSVNLISTELFFPKESNVKTTRLTFVWFVTAVWFVYVALNSW